MLVCVSDLCDSLALFGSMELLAVFSVWSRCTSPPGDPLRTLEGSLKTKIG